MPRNMTRLVGVGRASRLRRLVGVLALSAVTVACSASLPQAGQSSKAIPSRSAEKGAGGASGASTDSTSRPPREGECRNLAYADIYTFADNTPAIPCSKAHTAYTFDVKKLPDSIAFTGVQIENDAVQNFAGSTCRTSFARYVGGGAAERALSRLTMTYFVPNQRLFDLGSHWVRCDLIALKSDSVLADLPRRLRGVLNDEGSLDGYGVCSPTEPGSPGFRLVMCTQDHAYRALAALRLGGHGAAYPGEQITKINGSQRCQDLLADRLGAGGGYTYGWTYPSLSDWQAGQRFGYCWHKTTG